MRTTRCRPIARLAMTIGCCFGPSRTLSGAEDVAGHASHGKKGRRGRRGRSKGAHKGSPHHAAPSHDTALGADGVHHANGGLHTQSVGLRSGRCCL